MVKMTFHLTFQPSCCLVICMVFMSDVDHFQFAFDTLLLCKQIAKMHTKLNVFI